MWHYSYYPSVLHSNFTPQNTLTFRVICEANKQANRFLRIFVKLTGVFTNYNHTIFLHEPEGAIIKSTNTVGAERAWWSIFSLCRL